MNLYRQVNEWLTENYEPLGHWMYFNATPMFVGAVTMNSVPGVRIVQKFIDGSMKKELAFAIDMITSYDNSGTSDVNMEALDEVQNFSEWIDKQSIDSGPDFGEKCSIEKIEVLTNAPTLLVDTTNQLSKYQFQVKITYTERKE
jgi:hypothetical protein|nr:MAG TPA: Minor capsid protein from bacteriophage [Caudoviricetes sp.]